MPPDERLSEPAPYQRQQRMCLTWNADHAHQVMAGRARAALRTPEEQSRYGGQAWLAFMTRFRAQTGQAPYTTAGLHHIGPGDIRILGKPLPPHLAQLVYDAWCQGDLGHVSAILDDPPPAPGSLWALPQASPSAAAPQAETNASASATAPPGMPHQAPPGSPPSPAIDAGHDRGRNPGHPEHCLPPCGPMTDSQHPSERP
jgi:hypothetical protein